MLRLLADALSVRFPPDHDAVFVLDVAEPPPAADAPTEPSSGRFERPRGALRRPAEFAFDHVSPPPESPP